MVKLILWAVIGALIWWLLIKKLKSSNKGGPKQPGQSQQAKASVMVACAHCGIHLPQEDATTANTNNTTLLFCSAAHAQQHARENARSS